MLIRHEGMRLRAYKCSAGKVTIGCGRNCDDIGITREEALYLLNNDIARVVGEAVGAFPWFNFLNPPRQDVILSMLFNLGLEGFKNFKQTIEAITNGNFERAAQEMLDSTWHKQVGQRAVELAKIMATGEYVELPKMDY